MSEQSRTSMTWERGTRTDDRSLAAEQPATRFSDAALAYALLRLVVGVNLIVHLINRVLGGMGTFVASMVQGFQDTPLPAWSVAGFAWALPWVEGALGLLLALGLWTRGALVASILMMAALTFGTGLRGQWPTLTDQLVYAGLFAVLLALRRFDGLSLDSLRATRKTRAERSER